MNSASQPVSVLGLGRMGTALARRLADLDFPVTGWSRSGVALDGVRAAGSPAAAVAGADVVLLALYDATACRQVLARCAGSLRPGATVLNLATIAPAEAAELHRDTPVRYVQCPVLGSAPAAATGTLTLLYGGAAPAPAEAEVLAALGTVLGCGDAATAAAFKLVANGVLGDAIVALGQALGRARRLGLGHVATLDVLARTALGGLVARKRDRLTAGAHAPADFTAGALGKDADLLARVDPDSAVLPLLLASAGAPADADVAAIVIGLADTGHRVVDSAARLYAAPGVPADDELMAPLISYARGHATGDPAHFGAAFRPTAHVEGIRDDGFVSWDLDRYRANFTGTPAADEPARTRTVTELGRTGTVGHATMVLRHGADTFTDLFVLVCEHGEWRIANKVYHRC
ncbi:nuclear transport factor 2 family protein [Actinocatenispora sera]|uniref:nuclear transport factor 2 family protein n=1 Tax=Actinocatenispora sera TaxID=390989 RepID=UPI0033CCC27A